MSITREMGMLSSNGSTRKSRLGLVCVPLALALSAAVGWGQNVEELRLTVGKSIVLDYPADIRQISTSDPTVVDAVAVTTREMLLNAKGGGSATVIVWSKTGQRNIYSITVDQNLEPLRRLLRETFPNEQIQVQSSRDSVSLTGRVSNKDIADRAIALVTPFGKSVVNNLQIAASPIERQVVLRVKFAELDRSISKQFGVNLVSTGAANTIGSISTGQFSAVSPTTLTGRIGAPTTGASGSFSVTDALNIFAFRPDLNLSAFVKALQNEGVLQILAEPNLVTTNGKEASFLVGGEFPIPVLQGGGNAGAVTIQFREFGIRLSFNPLVTENGTIRMYVKPEVSTIDLSHAVNISGFLIPALSTRRIESNVELGIGQSFVIGGLLDDRVTDNMSKIPGLSAIPLLGQIFKSRDTRKERTELIVMVTPELTRPFNPGERTPDIPFPREFMAPHTDNPNAPPKVSSAPAAAAPAPKHVDAKVIAEETIAPAAEVDAAKPADKVEKPAEAEAAPAALVPAAAAPAAGQVEAPAAKEPAPEPPTIAAEVKKHS
jgi:pilus assembly protein CpaC